MTTKSTPAGLKKPAESSLDRVSIAHSSKLDGSAVWTAGREEPGRSASHDPDCQFFATCEARCSCRFSSIWLTVSFSACLIIHILRNATDYGLGRPHERSDRSRTLAKPCAFIWTRLAAFLSSKAAFLLPEALTCAIGPDCTLPPPSKAPPIKLMKPRERFTGLTCAIPHAPNTCSVTRPALQPAAASGVSW